MSEPQEEHETDTDPTPGPWTTDTNGSPIFVRSEAEEFRGNRVVCHISETVYDQRMPAEVNARLIAAAGTAAQEAREMGYDPEAVIEALPDTLDDVRRAILDLQDAAVEGAPSNKAEAAVQGAMHRLKVILAKAGADETMIPGDATVALEVVENDEGALRKVGGRDQ